MISQALYESNLASVSLIGRGKVRDLYTIDAERMLIVTTDRLSAFDVILPEPVPGKGRVLTQVSNFWFNKLQAIIPNHILHDPLSAFLQDQEIAELDGRGIVVQKLQPLPIEAVVRGYLIGSGWADYQATGAVSGVSLPASMRLAEKLPEPIFTPASKAAVGEHDENITFDDMVQRIGGELAEQVRKVSLQLYTQAAEYAYERGIIIADTKFEFGLNAQQELVLIDEVLTPDSSRFWPIDQYEINTSPPSFDKQFVRDYLETLDWDKKAPGPKLPQTVLDKTAEKYQEALQRLTQ